jgi:ribonuclease-3
MSSTPSLKQLETAIAYTFKDSSFIEQALTHRSHSTHHNERLEFLGDAILGACVSAMLYHRYPKLDEGDLSRVRSNLVKQSALAEIAQRLSLSGYLRLGEGELKSGGFRRPSILADAVEAVFAAVYLDGGFEAVKQVIEKLYDPVVERVDPQTIGKDAKTLLQELLQGHKLSLPTYTVVATHGAAHSQQFEVQCKVQTLEIEVRAAGASRRAAEQLAAKQAFDIAMTMRLTPARKRSSRAKKSPQLTLPIAVKQDVT